MKFILALSAFLGATMANDQQMADTKRATAVPVQTFFVPLPENVVFEKGFKKTNAVARGPVTSIISFAISTNDTVVWYDHWEDGYDSNVLLGASPSTQIWGDKNKTNGCAFGRPCNSDDDDILIAGQSIVIENDIPLDHHTKKASFLYDAKDKIMASYHIAVTRGSYPEWPGSYMAGAVEVHDTDSWGTSFEAPFGKTLKATSDKSRGNAYEGCLLFVQAAEDDTRVFAQNQWTTLAAGESHYIDADQGDIITSTKKVQADIVTSDHNSGYELRWFSLMANEYWSNKYLTPVGDSTAQTRVVIYNPESNTMTTKVITPSKTYYIDIAGKSSNNTRPIETGEGAIIESTSGKNFIAMSQTDTVSGANNDWGFPLVPFDQLSSQVLIGWGYGCKGGTCKDLNRLNQLGSRSVVYVSCVSKCDIYVDVDNDGNSDFDFKDVKPVRSTRIVDPNDHDMSGAIIWATEPGTGSKGTVVQIASAWGQDPERSWGGDQEAMDLGTTVLPFGTVKVSETVKLLDDKDGNGVISVGDVLLYTIRIQNNGQTDILPNQLTIKGPIEPQNLIQRQYNAGSCQYDSMSGSKVKCADDSLGSNGLKNPFKLPRRSGFHDITFTATIHDISTVYTDNLPQGGVLLQGNYPPKPFSVTSKMLFDAKIKLIKTIHRGNVDCSIVTQGLGPDDAKLIQSAPGADISYCYRAVNTGKTYLKLGSLVDPDIGLYTTIANTVLPPRAQHIIKVPRTSSMSPINGTATVVANPVFHTGNPIPDMLDVNADDYAGFDILYPNADVQLDKTVHLGHWTSCSPGDDMVSGFDNDAVTYCYAVKNTGDTHLKDYIVTDPLTGYKSDGAVPMLAPGQTYVFPGHKTKMTKTLLADAQVVAIPAHASGASIPGMATVQDTDPAGVRLLAKQTVMCIPGGGSDWVPPGPFPVITVTPNPQPPAPKAYTIFKPEFNTSAVESEFELKQNTFRGTTMGHNMARSSYVEPDGALQLKIGNSCNPSSDCTGGNRGMSGGYSVKFRTSFAGKVNITYQMKGFNSKENDKDEDGYGYVSLNDVVLGSHTYFLDGDKHDDKQTWVTVTRTVDVKAGDNEVIIGGYFTKRTTTDEHVTFLFRKVEIGFLP